MGVGGLLGMARSASHASGCRLHCRLSRVQRPGAERRCHNRKTWAALSGPAPLCVARHLAFGRTSCMAGPTGVGRSRPAERKEIGPVAARGRETPGGRIA